MAHYFAHIEFRCFWSSHTHLNFIVVLEVITLRLEIIVVHEQTERESDADLSKVLANTDTTSTKESTERNRMSLLAIRSRVVFGISFKSLGNVFQRLLPLFSTLVNALDEDVEGITLPHRDITYFNILRKHACRRALDRGLNA